MLQEILFKNGLPIPYKISTIATAMTRHDSQSNTDADIVCVKYRFTFCISVLLFVGVVAHRTTAQENAHTEYKFDFGKGRKEKGFHQISIFDSYTDKAGFGLEGTSVVIANDLVGKKASTDSFVTSDQPFFFSVALPEGNYHVKVTVGDGEGVSDQTIRAECRRMMVNRIQTSNGEHRTVEFTVHLRDSLIRNSDNQVKLKPRERSYLHWDHKLTLEFAGRSPKLNTIEITPENNDVITVFLAGNSTVVDQAGEPYAAWGQMIPSFFKPGKVAVANYAESGESLRSFISARRLEKILSLMKPGDYVFVEFGHNDQKQKVEGVGAFTTYKNDLVFFIAEVKKKGGIPVVVTSVQRRRFDSHGKIEETLGDYPAAGRETAKEQQVALIDLNASSKIMYETWGPVESINAFVHFPANSFPNQPNALEDNTHFRPFGAFEVAKLIVQGIRDAKLDLAQYILVDVPEFVSSRPGVLNDFYWPSSITLKPEKPAGN